MPSIVDLPVAQLLNALSINLETVGFWNVGYAYH
jgi:hypothetical protein